jgi:hypothetical protein
MTTPTTRYAKKFFPTETPPKEVKERPAGSKTLCMSKKVVAIPGLREYAPLVSKKPWGSSTVTKAKHERKGSMASSLISKRCGTEPDMNTSRMDVSIDLNKLLQDVIVIVGDEKIPPTIKADQWFLIFYSLPLKSVINMRRVSQKFKGLVGKYMVLLVQRMKKQLQSAQDQLPALQAKADLSSEKKLREEAITAALGNASRNLSVMDRNALIELKTQKSPPPLIVVVCNCIGYLLYNMREYRTNKIGEWPSILREPTLMQQLVHFDPNKVEQVNVDKFDELIRINRLEVEMVRKHSIAAAALFAWALNARDTIKMKQQIYEIREVKPLRNLQIKIGRVMGRIEMIEKNMGKINPEENKLRLALKK